MPNQKVDMSSFQCTSVELESWIPAPDYWPISPEVNIRKILNVPYWWAISLCVSYITLCIEYAVRFIYNFMHRVCCALCSEVRILGVNTRKPNLPTHMVSVAPGAACDARARGQYYNDSQHMSDASWEFVSEQFCS